MSQHLRRGGWGVNFPPLTDAQRAVVEHNRSLVGWVLRRRRTPEAEWDDSFQDGVLGLMRAAQLYDPAAGYTFATYAHRWIRYGVQWGLEARLGLNYRRLHGRVALQDRGGWQHPLSLDQRLDGDDGGTYGDLLLVDRDPGPDTRGTNLGYLAELEQLLASWDLDSLDRAIADDLLTPCDDPHHIAGRVARLHGVSTEIVRRRRIRLQEALLAWARAGAA